MKEGWKLTALRIFAFVAVLALTAVLFYYRDQVARFEAFGYPGIFLISFFSNATIILPVPGILITSAMGTIFNPYGVALAAGSGATCGEISGYLLGFSGQGVIENKTWYERISRWMKKYGDVIVFLLALIPNPLFDIAGLVAGAMKMPLWRFLVWTWLGKTIKMFIFAIGGATVISFFGL
jgi:membrane protein YqaA with SNARE-associated domain